MVLISLFFACVASHQPVGPDTAPATVATVITLASPRSGTAMSVPTDVVATVHDVLARHGLAARTVSSKSAMHSLGTRGRRIQALLTAVHGGLSLLIETSARPRSPIGGRFPWSVDVTFTVAKGQAEALVDHRVIAVNLGHIHSDEAAALAAAKGRIAQRAATLIDRYRRDSP